MKKPSSQELAGMVGVLTNASKTLARCSDDLKAIANKLWEDGDVLRLSDAMQCISNCFSNLHTVALVARLARAYQRDTNDEA